MSVAKDLGRWSQKSCVKGMINDEKIMHWGELKKLRVLPWSAAMSLKNVYK
jgi:hypothetical protein